MLENQFLILVWDKGTTKMKKAELQKKLLEWTWNILDYFKSPSPLDLSPFAIKNNKTHFWLIGIKCMKFHGSVDNTVSYGQETIFNQQLWSIILP